MNRLKSLYKMLVTLNDWDLNNCFSLMKEYEISRQSSKIVDIGCGFGRLLKPLKDKGFLQSIGVEINAKTVAANNKNGLSTMTPQDFKKTTDKFDLMLMFHIIEHFNYNDCLKFIDDNLGRVKTGGYLIIASPLLTPWFYNDMDHIKPYNPWAIQMVFENKNAQVQEYSKNKMRLLKVKFRKSPRMSITGNRCLYLISVIIYKVSFGMIGKNDAWMGIFVKE